jgi:hypothetical protein
MGSPTIREQYNTGRTGDSEELVQPISKQFWNATALSLMTFGAVALIVGGPSQASAAQLVCRKVVAENISGEGANSAAGSRVKCALGEMLTGGTCYPETRPEPDGTCETSAMGIIQPVVDHGGTTEEAFFTCLQTGGSECPVEARTRAMAICCKIVDEAAPAAGDKKAAAPAVQK